MTLVSLSLVLARISSRILCLFRFFVKSFILRGLASLNICKIAFQMLLTRKGILHI